MINLRSQDIANLDNVEFHIVGCGAIGSSVAMQLTRLGGNNFYLYDFELCFRSLSACQRF